MPIICYNCLRDLKSADDVFPNEPGDFFVFDASIGFYFYPFAKVVNDYEQNFLCVVATGKRPTISIPHSVNDQGLVTGLRTSNGIRGIGAYL